MTSPPRKLRSNFPRGSYLWAVRNAQWHGMGMSEADCEKPKIAVVNSSSELAACFSHLDAIVPVIKEAIRAAGGVPFEVRTAAPSDFVTGAGARGAYMLAARDLVTNDIEVAVEGAQLDGMVCLTSCDKTVPGQLMAAARLNIPTLMVPCGYQPSGEYNGRHVDIEEVFIGAMHAVTGQVPVDDVVGMSRHAIRGPGVCSGLGTANSMHIVCEALGMALPGSAPVAALTRRDVGRRARRRRAHRADGVGRPEAARHPDAGRVRQRGARGARGGRLGQLRQAPAGGGDRRRVRRSTSTACSSASPTTCRCSPACDRSASALIEEFEAAGGCRAVMKQLEPLLDARRADGDRPHGGRQPAPMRASPTPR